MSRFETTRTYNSADLTWRHSTRRRRLRGLFNPLAWPRSVIVLLAIASPRLPLQQISASALCSFFPDCPPRAAAAPEW